MSQNPWVLPKSLSSTFVFLSVTIDASSHNNTGIASFYISYLEGNIFLNMRSSAERALGNETPYHFVVRVLVYTFPHSMLRGSGLSIITSIGPSRKLKLRQTKEAAQVHTRTPR